MKKTEIRKWVEGVHLLGIITFFIGPLIVYFAFEEKEIQKSTKVALNWQLSLLIYLVIASMIPMFVPLLLYGPLFYLWGNNILVNILVITNIIFCIIAFSKATKNEKWDYPLSIKFFN